MLESICQWDGCDRPAYARGLCERCNMRARRAGTILTFTSPPVSCRHCGVQYAEGTKSGKWFCSSDCQQLNLKQRRAQRRVALLGERTCSRCEEPVPLERRADARHCSVICQQAEWYEKNDEMLRDRARQWAQSNLGRVRDYDARREQRKKNLPFEKIDREQVWVRDENVCWICSKPVLVDAPYPHPLSRSLDHIVPLNKGGTHTMENVATAHLRCNVAKKDKLLGHLPEWRRSEEESDAVATKPA